MFWRLLPHATICVASDRLILLDSRRDRYLMVPDQIAAPVTAWLSGRPMVPPPQALLDLLASSGTLEQSDPRPCNAERFVITIPTTLAASTSYAEARRHRTRIFQLVMGTWLGLKLRGFDRMLRRLSAQAIYGSPATSAALERLAAYDRARRFVPLARVCLLDSLAQYRWLGQAGITCRLVFGVTATPFAAHCWLQNDEAILNDTYEHVSRFTPIMVL